jgi:TonB family protein
MSATGSMTPLIDTGPGYTYRSAPREAVCLSIAAAIHALVFLWNPTILKGSFAKPTNPLVEIGMVEETASAPVMEAPKKMTLLETLKDMLTKPEPVSPHIDPVAPAVPIAPPPMLRERAMPHPILNSLRTPTPDELALAKTPTPITANQRNFQVPNTAPILQAKSFGGIRAKDLPFDTNNETITTPGQAVPIAVGNSSAKSALSYVNPALRNNSKTTLQSKKFLGSNSEPSGLNAASTAIQLSGNTNPSIAVNTPPVLNNKQAGGMINRALMGRTDSTPALRTVATTPAQAEQQLSVDSPSNTSLKKPRNGFEISGKLANRTILKKVIPQYPSWAEEQGIIGTLRLYFTVTPEGAVRANIKVTKTTGNPQLDQVGIDALTQWQFAPQPSTNEDDVQWGIITFTFSLAS